MTPGLCSLSYKPVFADNTPHCLCSLGRVSEWSVKKLAIGTKLAPSLPQPITASVNWVTLPYLCPLRVLERRKINHYCNKASGY